MSNRDKRRGCARRSASVQAYASPAGQLPSQSESGSPPPKQARHRELRGISATPMRFKALYGLPVAFLFGSSG